MFGRNGVEAVRGHGLQALSTQANQLFGLRCFLCFLRAYGFCQFPALAFGLGINRQPTDTTSLMASWNWSTWGELEPGRISAVVWEIGERTQSLFQLLLGRTRFEQQEIAEHTDHREEEQTVRACQENHRITV